MNDQDGLKPSKKMAGNARFACKELSISSLPGAVRMEHLQTPSALGAIVPRPDDFERIGRAGLFLLRTPSTAQSLMFPRSGST